MPSRKKKGSGKKKKGSQKKKKLQVGGEALQPHPPSAPPPTQAPARVSPPQEKKEEAPSSPPLDSDDSDDDGADDDAPMEDPEPLFTGGPQNTGFYFIKPDEEKRSRGDPNAAHLASKEQEDYDNKRFKTPVFPARTQIDLKKSFTDDTDVFCTEYSRDGLFLAAGCGDGSIRTYNTGGKLAYTFGKQAGTDDALPITCMRYRPSSTSSKTKYVMIVASADGTLSHWHMTTSTCIFTITEEDNQIYAVDYNTDGSQFATAGRDAKVRVYDENTKSLLSTLSGVYGGMGRGVSTGATGHSNRIYSVKFKPGDNNVILSGGWDNTVQIWDLRSGRSERSIYGPHICGDAIDVSPCGNHVLTGSWRPENALQVWDFASGELMQDIEWQLQTAGKGRPEMLYSARYSPGGRLIAATGTGSKEMKIFDAKNSFKCLDHVTVQGAYSCAFSYTGTQLAVGGEGNFLSTLDISANYI